MADTTTTQSNQKPCKTCNSARGARDRFDMLNYELMYYLKNNRVIRRDSCILCVQKHIGRAMEYYTEMLTAIGSGKPSGEAAIDVKLTHLSILGHLGCAIEEADEYTDLQEYLIAQERNYRYDGVEPNWKEIAALIIRYES